MRIVRSLIRRVLRRLGFGVWKVDSSETLNFENLLHSVLHHHKAISLLHIGAHDGKSFTDPLYNFVIQNEGRFYGVYVEPVEPTYQKLIGNLGEISGLTFLNVAVHPSLKSIEIHQMDGLARPSRKYATGLSTVYKTRLLAGSHNLRPTSISTTTVRAITVEEAIDHLPIEAQNIPLVVCVDTEGLDFEIVRSILLGPHRPLIIRFEHNLCDSRSEVDTEAYLDLVSDLNRIGYQVFTELNDATAIFRNAVPMITRHGKW